MPSSIGTRTDTRDSRVRPDQGAETRVHQQDLGLAERKVTTATFTASNGRITGSASDFTSFKLNDWILIQGTNLNNGHKTITGLDGGSQAFLVLDPPPKDEGPIAATVVRVA
jgi:hypothetical protein